VSRIEVDGVELAFFGGGPVAPAAPEGSKPGDLVGGDNHEKTSSASGIYLPPLHRCTILCSESIQVLVRHDRPTGTGTPSSTPRVRSTRLQWAASLLASTTAARSSSPSP